jgi:hypothetical protein
MFSRFLRKDESHPISVQDLLTFLLFVPISFLPLAARFLPFPLIIKKVFYGLIMK